MSYPAPPGLPKSNIPPHHASLPARPPPSAAASVAAFKPPPGSGTFKPAFTAFAPRSVAVNTYRTSSPAQYSAPPVTAYSSGPQHSQPAPQQDLYPAQPQYSDVSSYAAAPQIRNPFVPNSGTASSTNPYSSQNATYDPELEAQIQQWQSAYVSKDSNSGNASSAPNTRRDGATGANTAPLASNRLDTSSPAVSGPHAPSARTDSPAGVEKTVQRSGGGTTWQDSSLLEWDPAHFRIFVGNLAGEVTDDSLLKAFAKYPSVQKARVIRDKRTTKSKGYGFVSFSDGDDYFLAAREMQGKYIGSHPVSLTRSTTEVRATTVHHQKGGGKHGKRGKGGSGGGAGQSGKTEHGGISKKQPKTKGGLKVLG